MQTAHGSLHLARKAEQVPQGLREFEANLSALFLIKTNGGKKNERKCSNSGTS